MTPLSIDTIIFDLGGVLIDWNPRYLYRKIFDDEKEMQWFLTEVCSPDWNEQQDAGRSWEEATQLLIQHYPHYEQQILAFWKRWPEMLNGAIETTVYILEHLHSQAKHRLLALTNWSAETFPVAQQQFDFLNHFEGILVSGEEGLKKPDPKIYQLLLDRYSVDSTRSVFIDDSLRNVQAAQQLGIQAIHFQSGAQLKQELKDLGVI